jgi:hypothetical protein
MSQPQLEPVTREELWLAEILVELRAIRRKLGRRDPQRPPTDDEEVLGAIEEELRVPKRKR